MQKKVFAIDLDGTLTEHRTWISEENLEMLDMLEKKGIRTLVVGAGQVRRIFTQLKKYPTEIIGNYGLQYVAYREELGDIEFLRDIILPCDKESVIERAKIAREKFGYTEIVGESVEFHPSGCVTFPLLGTKAAITDKLVFDKGGDKRREILDGVAELFPEYSVFVAGSSSFDMVPMPYNKYYALKLFMDEMGYTPEDIVYFGDDFSRGGNDEPILLSGIDFVKVKGAATLPDVIRDYIGE